VNAQRLKLAPSSPPAPPSRTDPINTWLDTLSLVMRLPRDQREGIRDELSGHLRDRVRDLMLTGLPEPAATQAALEELGDAVKLAHRFRVATRSPARRLVMNLSVFAVAGAALVTSVVALRAGGPDPKAPVVMPQPQARAPEQVEKIKLTAGPNTTWADLIKQVGEKAGMPLEVRWRALGEMGYEPGAAIHVEMKDQPLPGAFQFIAYENGQPGNDVDYRVIDGRLVIATTSYFDQQDTVLVAYDLSKLAEQRAENGASTPEAAACSVTTEFRQVIQQMVHSEGWQDNGGTLASTAVFGSKLFIKAPKRYHTEIQWVMDQLPKPEQHAEVGLDRPANLQIDAQRSVPVLHDIPILSDQFVRRTPVRFDVPITVRAENGGAVEVTQPDGNLKADEVRIAPAAPPTDPSSTTPASPPRGR
jgi:hypothetical protein